MPGPYFCTDWALWAGLVIELTCPCVCVSVCMCHCKTPKGPIADFGRQSHNVTFILFWIFQFDVSLLCRPKLIGLVFSSKLQLPKTPGKFQHDQFCVDNFGNFMLKYIIFLVFIFIITRCSLIYLPSLPDWLKLLATMFGENVLCFLLLIIDQAGYIS